MGGRLDTTIARRTLTPALSEILNRSVIPVCCVINARVRHDIAKDILTGATELETHDAPYERASACVLCGHKISERKYGVVKTMRYMNAVMRRRDTNEEEIPIRYQTGTIGSRCYARLSALYRIAQALEPLDSPVNRETVHGDLTIDRSPYFFALKAAIDSARNFH